MKLKAHWFWRLLQPHSGDEDAQRREYILNIVLLGSIALSLAAVITVLIFMLPFVGREHGAGLGFMLIPLFVFSALYVISRRNYSRASAYALVFIYFLLGIYTMAAWGLLLGKSILLFVLLIVMASVLISTRFAFVMTGLSSLTLLGIAYLLSRNIIHPDLYWIRNAGGWDDAVTYIFLLSVITLVTWLSNREIEHSLERARASETALAHERDALEVKVQERTRALQEAQQAELSRLYQTAEFGRLATGLVHDLVTPLTTVSVNLEQLENRDQSQLVKRAKAGVRWMERYIQALRKQAQRQGELTEFRPAKEIELISHFFSQRARTANVSISVTCPPDLTLFGDPTKFHQAVTNLVANALDAYDALTGSPRRREVKVTVTSTADRIELTVHDWGVGISPSRIGRIFDPFYTTKHRHEGTGIGLFIVKEVMEKDFGGTVTVTSSPADGTAFTITAPLRSHDRA